MGGLLLAIVIVGALFVATGVARRMLAEAEAEKPRPPAAAHRVTTDAVEEICDG